MQTFMPYPDFKDSIKCLDNKRLGKQRVEANQIYKILKNYPNKNGKSSNAWKNHPAVKMWKGYEDALAEYYNFCVIEWINRGFKNTMELIKVEQKYNIPHWIGRNEFHASHRSNLLRKDFNYYSKFGWKECNSLDYIWPI